MNSSSLSIPGCRVLTILFSRLDDCPCTWGSPAHSFNHESQLIADGSIFSLPVSAWCVPGKEKIEEGKFHGRLCMHFCQK